MLIPIETVGADIRARIDAGDRALGKAEEHYIAAGLQLAEAKKRLRETGEMAWPAFLNHHCKIRRRRADDIISIAEGRTTLADLKEKNRERVAAHRERKKSDVALRNARDDVAAEIAAMPDNQEKEENHDDLRAIIERQSKEIVDLKAQSERLRARVKEQAGIIKARDDMVAIAERQSQEAHTRAMFAEADKERLAERLVELEAENARLLADLDALTAPATASDDDRQFNALKSAWEKATPEVQQRWIAREGMTPAATATDDFDPSNLWLAKERAAA